MGRKVFIVSDEQDFVSSTKAFCEARGGSVKSFTTAEWTRQAGAPGFGLTLTGEMPPLSAGAQPLEGAKILQFPHGGQAAGSQVQTINEMESVAIQNAIHNFNGNLTEAAKALGIGRATLYRKVKQYNIDPSAARRKRAA